MKIGFTSAAFLGMLVIALGDSPTFLNLPSASVGTSLVGASPKQPERDGILWSGMPVPPPKTQRNVVRNSPEPAPIEGARWIPVSRGTFALVDDADYPYLSQFQWTLKATVRTGYPNCHRRINGKVMVYYMHRVILNPPVGLQVDHIDGDGLNCRRSNLRLCTLMENHRNMKIHVGIKTSRFKGVYFNPRLRQKWVAHITHKGNKISLGNFSAENEAAMAYDAAAVRLWGEFAKLNFPCA